MARGIGNLGNIVQDFTDSFNETFGGHNNSGSEKGGKSGDLFKAEYSGSLELDTSKWLGNSKNPSKVRYGFTIMNLAGVRANSHKVKQDIDLANSSGKVPPTTYYLDIPPQNITQKEIFATNIQATRKGVIVESEGVVFKDIIIEGTTGVFPGKRASSNIEQANFGNPLDPPKPPSGVDPETGTSKARGVTTLSGYEEFLRLRQYFLKYAYDKVNSNGDLFLIFINEKDNQSLIVEPLEFTMTRNARSPMTYNYRIVLKAIGTLNAIFEGLDQTDTTSILEQIGNVSDNIAAVSRQVVAVMNNAIRTLERIEESISYTIINPMRQIGYAAEAVANGTAKILALPSTLQHMVSEIELEYAEMQSKFAMPDYKRRQPDKKEIDSNVIFTPEVEDRQLSSNVIFTPKPLTGPPKLGTISAQAVIMERAMKNALANDAVIPIPRSFVERLRDRIQNLADKLADSVNLGDDGYNTIERRIATSETNPLKVPTDGEILLLGALQNMIIAYNTALASNKLFEPEIDLAFKVATETFGEVLLEPPTRVKEVIINDGDTLEKIAAREYGNSLKWVDLVIINNLKPPYIDDNRKEGILAYGDTILIGNR